MSKRARIIELGKQGLTRGSIVKVLVEEGYENVSYQYVFNTLKERSIDVPKASREGVSLRSLIIEKAKLGLTRAEIVKALKAEGNDKVDYHYVFMITKQAGFKFEPALKKMDRLSDSIVEALEAQVTVSKKKKATKTELIEA